MRFRYPQPVSLIITMLVSFSISFSLMWWQRTDPRGGLPAPAEITPLALEAIPIPAMRQPVQQAAVREPGGKVRRAAASAESSAAEISSNSEDKPEMPVMFTLVKTTVYVDDENRAGAKISQDAYEGIVFNTSENTLDFTVTEVNLPTMEKSESQFTLAKGNQRHFGIAQGLKMLSGDQITLRSQAYRDIAKIIP